MLLCGSSSSASVLLHSAVCTLNLMLALHADMLALYVYDSSVILRVDCCHRGSSLAQRCCFAPAVASTLAATTYTGAMFGAMTQVVFYQPALLTECQPALLIECHPALLTECHPALPPCTAH